MFVMIFAELNAMNTPVEKRANTVTDSTSALKNAIWKLETPFDITLKVKVGPKSGKGLYMVYVPARGTSNKKKKEILFRAGGMEGLNPAFGKFIRDSLETVVSKWGKLSDVHQWVEEVSQSWRDKVRKDWIKRCNRTTRSSVNRQLQMVVTAPSPILYHPKTRNGFQDTISVPVPLVQSGDKCATRRVA